MDLLSPASQQPTTLGASATGNPRNKVALKPGRSLMDWIRLGNSGRDLTGVGGQMLSVTPEELAKHNTVDDAWIAIRGRVYNVSAYMEYHPGGELELMRGVGTDASRLFDEIHKWVNFSSMLNKCLVGKLVSSSATSQPNSTPRRGSRSSSLASSVSLSVGSSISDSLPPPTSTPPPRYDWIQTDDKVTITTYTRWRHMHRNHVITDRQGRNLKLTFHIDDHIFHLHLELEHDIQDHCTVRVGQVGGKVDVELMKVEAGHRWSTLGTVLATLYTKTTQTNLEYRSCEVVDISAVTHDTKLFTVQIPASCHMSVPTGRHVAIRATVQGMEVSQSYTPVPVSLFNEPDPDNNYLYFMIKIYPHGALTSHLDKLVTGDVVDVSEFRGPFHWGLVESCSRLVLCAAGTGFTPMAGLILHALSVDKIRSVSLLLFNKTERDIPWRDQLDALQHTHKDRFRVSYILSEPGPDWSGLTGRVRRDLLEGHIAPDTTEDVFCAACGPTPFTQLAISLAEQLGVPTKHVHGFLG